METQQEDGDTAKRIEEEEDQVRVQERETQQHNRGAS